MPTATADTGYKNNIKPTDLSQLVGRIMGSGSNGATTSHGKEPNTYWYGYGYAVDDSNRGKAWQRLTSAGIQATLVPPVSGSHYRWLSIDFDQPEFREKVRTLTQNQTLALAQEDAPSIQALAHSIRDLDAYWDKKAVRDADDKIVDKEDAAQLLAESILQLKTLASTHGMGPLVDEKITALDRAYREPRHLEMVARIEAFKSEDRKRMKPEGEDAPQTIEELHRGMNGKIDSYTHYLQTQATRDVEGVLLHQDPIGTALASGIHQLEMQAEKLGVEKTVAALISPRTGRVRSITDDA